MKLEEAASILGLSLEDITVDSLKQTYKKLAVVWDKNRCFDQASHDKCDQITEAYKKLSSVMDGKDLYRGDDSHEVAAFMRMFMDMVGISESDSIPAAMTFGMMFGANQNIVEEWSTDEDGDEYDDDEDDCDDEEDDDEYMPDEYFDEYAAATNNGAIPMPMPMHSNPYASSISGPMPAMPLGVEAWEPQVKQYSNMNLKDQLNNQRIQSSRVEVLDDDSDQGDGADAGGEGLTEAEKERKLKLAKKRAEKRKKQKEKEKKKSKEANGGNGDGDESKDSTIDYSQLSAEELAGVVRKFADSILAELMQSVTNGQLGKVNQILSFDFVEEVPPVLAADVVAQLKQMLPTTPVLHQCVTSLARLSAPSSGAAAPAPGNAGANGEAFNTAIATALAARRLDVAKYLLSYSRPAFELATPNAAGLSVLHYAIANGDLKVAQLVIRAMKQAQQDNEERKGQLNINSRCHRQGWAPIHYAVERMDLDAVKLLVQNGANVQATVATDKRQTPLELAKQKLKATAAAGKPAVQAVIDELQAAIERAKQQNKEAETKTKKQEPAAVVPEVPPKAAPTATPPQASKDRKTAGPIASASASSAAEPVKTAPGVEAAAADASAKSDKKKKKKEKEKEKEKTAAPLAAATAPSPTPAPAPAPAAPAVIAPPVKAAPAPQPAAALSSGSTAKGGKPALSEPAPPSAAAPTANSTPAPAVSAAPAPAPAGKGKKNKNAKQAAPAPAPEPTINAMAEMSVSSRDELVDRLLAMGFREADCLQAISLFGTDVDQAISWLCERPVAAPAPPAPAAKTGAGDAGKVPDAVAPSAASAAPAAVSAASGATPAAAVPASPVMSSAQKLQKEKEELRRINQAWNQKAIDEKRKAEALRKQQEEEKLLAEQQAKQQQELLRQQQAQQEFLYQQHLQQQQQFMALQQQQMQTFFAQQAAMYGVSAGLSNNTTMAGASNFPLASLQHMNNMLGTPGAHGLAAQAGVGAAPPGSSGPFGGHAGGLPTSSGTTPSLQTLSGAMAMAMSADSQPFKPATSAGFSSTSHGLSHSTASLSDAMSLASFGASSVTPRAPGPSVPSVELGGSSGVGAFGLGGVSGGFDSSAASAGSNLGLFGPSSAADPLSGFGGFSGGLSSTAAPFRPQETIVDGALELSAGAKPFVPRFGSSASSASSASPASSSLSGPSIGAFGVGSSLGAGLGGLNLGSNPWGGSGGGLDSKPAGGDSTNISSFLSGLLPSGLNLDEDNFEFGDPSAIIPDLDSFLLNDN